MTMPSHRNHKANPDPEMKKHHTMPFQTEKLKSGRAMMESIKEVDYKDVASETVREVDMSKEPEKKGEEWQ